jgi:REP element-mobilizing transposase RayT
MYFYDYQCYRDVMPRPRKIHVQQELDLRKDRRGGKRKHAGRPAAGPRSSERHVTRERFDKLTVVHVTLRLVERYGTLRKRDAFLALRRATRAVLERADFRIVHASPETDHLHLVAEAENNGALSRGMQAFQISAAQHLNRVMGRRRRCRVRGRVFADRYNARPVRSPTQARNTLNYVLNNWRRHLHDDAHAYGDERFWDVDYMSSAVSFPGWKELETKRLIYDVGDDLRLCVSLPQSWLLAAGWRKAGPISMYAVPGPLGTSAQSGRRDRV